MQRTLSSFIFPPQLVGLPASGRAIAAPDIGELVICMHAGNTLGGCSHYLEDGQHRYIFFFPDTVENKLRSISHCMLHICAIVRMPRLDEKNTLSTSIFMW